MITADDNIRVGEVILSASVDVQKENHVRSGFRVVEVLPNGLRVQRLHAVYLTEEPVESWTLRWDQLQNFRTLPEGTQLPLV